MDMVKLDSESEHYLAMNTMKPDAIDVPVE